MAISTNLSDIPLPEAPLRTFEPRDIPECVELPADGVEDTDGAETEPLMERQGRGIGESDADDDRLDVLVLERGEERSVERRPASTSRTSE